MVENYAGFVNEQVEFHRKRAEHPKTSDYGKRKHLQVAEAFEGLLAHLASLEAIAEKHRSCQPSKTDGVPRQLRLSLTPSDIDGLPADLIEELSITGSDKMEFSIVTMMDEAGGMMSLDQILVGLFRQTGEVHKRTAMTNRMYRMIQKGLIYSVPNKKGVYSSRPFTEQEVKDLLGEKPESIEDIL